MAANGRFKRSLFGGFRRKAVLSYIEDYQIETQATIDTVSRERDAAQQALDVATEENAALAEQVASCEAALNELRALADTLTERIRSQDELHSRIGDVYVEAKADARRIVDTANADAREILASADSTASLTVEKISDAVSHLNGARSDLENMVRAFSEKVAQIDLSLSAAKARLAASKASSGITADDLASKGVLPK